MQVQREQELSGWRGTSAQARLPRRRSIRVAESPREPDAKTQQGSAWSSRIRWIFAAKTTASAIIALLIAFTFDLDQPQWALLTVFIVAQPQSGLVLAKSFHRIIGTFVGAAVALLLVSNFAQERVLFLGALALWLGLCTFASQYARNFTAYGFVLSGYTAAIIGIPGALAAQQAFFIAVARVTEVCLGIIVTATISHLILPISLAGALRQGIAAARNRLADHAIALLNGDGGASVSTKLLGDARTIKDASASAVFEDRDLRDRSDRLRRLDLAFVRVVTIGQLLRWQLDAFRLTAKRGNADLDEALARAAIAIRDWRRAAIDAAQLGGRLVLACVATSPAEPLRDNGTDAEIVQRIATAARLREFLASFIGYARAYEAFALGKVQTPRPVGLSGTQDWMGAALAGVRAALAVVLVGTFWIVADWPRGSTAVILAAVVTARLATMEGGAKAAIAGTMVVAVATLPAFVVVEVLLAHAEGFEMFTLVVAPVLFLCAYLMGNTKLPLAYLTGFLVALYFASVGAFQNRMTYDAVAFVNTSIAVIFAIAVGAVLFAVVAPETPEIARRRFKQAVRRLWGRVADPRHRHGRAELQRAAAKTLEQLQPKGLDDIITWETGVALLGAGCDLIQLPRAARASATQLALERDMAALARYRDAKDLARALQQLQAATAEALVDLRACAVGSPALRTAARRIAALSAIDDGLRRGAALALRDPPGRTDRHAA